MQEGDQIGLVRKSSGALHYFINGIDQGVATTRTPQPVWGVVDLYGMAVQVTIIDVDSEGGTRSRPCLDNNSANCLLYTSPSPRDGLLSRMPSSA